MSMQDAGGMPVLDAEDQDLPIQIARTAEQATLALLNALEQLATKAAGATDTREQHEAAKGALALAQAIVVLDPELDGQGSSLQHQIALEEVRGAQQVAVERTRGENALAQAREAARAPSPARSVQVKRDSNGRASQYDVTGG